jgi:hypothetical protein
MVDEESRWTGECAVGRWCGEGAGRPGLVHLAAGVEGEGVTLNC